MPDHQPDVAIMNKWTHYAHRIANRRGYQISESEAERVGRVACAHSGGRIAIANRIEGILPMATGRPLIRTRAHHLPTTSSTA